MSNIQLSFPLPWNIVTKIGEYKGSQRKISTSLLLVAVGQLFVFYRFHHKSAISHGKNEI